MTPPDDNERPGPYQTWFDTLIGVQEQRRARLRRLWQMTPAQRIAAMYRGELTTEQLAAWSAKHPDQVPRLDGEWWWLAIKTPEIAEAGS